MSEESQETKAEWKTVSFPKEFIDEIDKLLKNPYVKANYPMLSRGEFLRRSGSELINKLKKEIEDETGIRP